MSEEKKPGKPYTWKQDDKKLTIKLPCDEGLKGKDVSCDIRPSAISLNVRGSNPVFENEALEKAVTSHLSCHQYSNPPLHDGALHRD